MITIKGKSVFSAIAIGKIQFLKKRESQVVREKAKNPQEEKKRFEQAKDMTLEQLDALYDKALREVGETNAQIFEVHKMMVEDDDYNESILNIIENQQVNAEYAVALTSDNFAEMFEAMEDEYMKARSADIKDISNRIIDNLTYPDHTNSASINSAHKGILCSDNEGLIICADDLSPSETVALDKDKVLAFVTRFGSSNSHTAILARTMNIPAIIGVTDLSESMNGKLAAVDGFSGTVYIEPNEETLTCIEKKQQEELHKKQLLQELKGKENVTLDGTKINIYANISGPKDIGAVLVNDAGGIGLFRSEFLYLESDDFPDEQTQFTAYKKVLESMAGKRVIIRTMDIGADKQIDYFGLDKEENPALGYRAIRICLNQPAIFRTQLRALLRASVYGKLSIMFPMITSLEEVLEIKSIYKSVMQDLDAEGIKYSEDIELGIMIETPAAAIISDLLAPEVDFFSVGTNDLTQYTLAVDRQNPKLERFCDTHHEAILRLIEHAAKSAHKHGKWIGICGELAADTDLTERWLKMGIDELSVSPPFVLALRDKVRKIDLKK